MPEFVTPIPILIMVAIAAYLLGSVPFGIVISKLFGLPDPRTVGSKNIGATNVLRSGSKVAALLTVLLDGAKGGIAVVIARMVAGEDAAQVAALTSFLGHCFPIFLRFRGGKGVATLLGTLVGLAPIIGLTALLAWLFMFFVFRISSLSALVAALVTPVFAVALGYPEMAVLLFVMACIVWLRHRANIVRLMNRTEPTTTWSRK